MYTILYPKKDFFKKKFEKKMFIYIYIYYFYNCYVHIKSLYT